MVKVKQRASHNSRSVSERSRRRREAGIIPPGFNASFRSICFERAIPRHARDLVISTEVEKSLSISTCGARDYSFWIYIVTNRNHSVLYIGVTNSLSRRSWHHYEGTGAIFPSAYRCTKLIYYEITEIFAWPSREKLSSRNGHARKKLN